MSHLPLSRIRSISSGSWKPPTGSSNALTPGLLHSAAGLHRRVVTGGEVIAVGVGAASVVLPDLDQIHIGVDCLAELQHVVKGDASAVVARHAVAVGLLPGDNRLADAPVAVGLFHGLVGVDGELHALRDGLAAIFVIPAAGDIAQLIVAAHGEPVHAVIQIPAHPGDDVVHHLVHALRGEHLAGRERVARLQFEQMWAEGRRAVLGVALRELVLKAHNELTLVKMDIVRHHGEVVGHAGVFHVKDGWCAMAMGSSLASLLFHSAKVTTAGALGDLRHQCTEAFRRECFRPLNLVGQGVCA